MLRFGRDRRPSLKRIRSWAQQQTVNVTTTLADRQRLRDWHEAQVEAKRGLELIGYAGFVDLGQGVLWHQEQGLLRDDGLHKTSLGPFEAFAIFGGCQPLIDALADALELLTAETGDTAHY